MKITLRLALGILGSVTGGIAAWRVVRAKSRPGWYRPADDRDALALVTGGSSGIGAAFARRLARDGYSLILVARRKDRLDALAAELRSCYGVTVETRSADLSQSDDVRVLEQTIAGLDRLDLLVNNAGFGTTGNFADAPIEGQAAMIKVHIMASVRLTRAALPGMIARRRGGVINVSSVAALLPGLVGDATYTATKGYLNTFTETLQRELHGSGVVVEALCPGFTHSEFHDTPDYRAAGFDKSSIPAVLWMTAPAVVDAALHDLGRNIICVPGRVNQVIAALPRFVFGIAFAAVSRFMMQRR